MVKKRIAHFLILEVLIAFLLIAMTILPFSSYPYRAFAKEVANLEKMEIEPYFTAGFLEAIEHVNEEDFDLADQVIPFGKSDTLLLKRHVHIKKEHNPEKKGTLLVVDLSIKAKHTHITKQKVFYMPNLETTDEI